MKTFFNSDWLRAVQFLGNTVQFLKFEQFFVIKTHCFTSVVLTNVFSLWKY